MKVLETTPSPAFTMGKKKHRLRKQSTNNDMDQSDSSDDGGGASAATGQPCAHIGKAVNCNAMRKSVQKQVFGECGTCEKEKLTGQKADKGVAPTCSPEGDHSFVTSTVDQLCMEEVEPTIWVCLSCGHQGCDRNSQGRHALHHALHDTVRSGNHCIVINTTSWAAWCYACDDEVPVESIKRLKECADFLKKMTSIPRAEASALSGKRGQAVGGTVGASSAEQPQQQQSGLKGRPGSGRGGTSQAMPLCQKVKGLSNLGNTCFFNAVMQNLCQTPCLEISVTERGKKGQVLPLPGRVVENDNDGFHSSSYSSSDEEFRGVEFDKRLPPIEIVLPERGGLTQAVLSFLQEMNNSSGKSATVTPSALFGQVCKKAPRFRGYQQQDSHELLRYLLDNMKSEEIKRARTGILKYFKLSENINPKKVEMVTRMKVKEYGRQAKVTFVDSIFGGQLISTVVCEECSNVSQVFEPFLDLSLSITEEKPHRPNLSFAGKKQPSGGLSTADTKPNKFQEKKQRKQAKREAKRKQKLAKNKVVPLGGDPAKAGAAGDIGEGESKDPDQQGKKEGEDIDGSQDSELEDTSDADVEDNLDNDSVKNKFGVPETTAGSEVHPHVASMEACSGSRDGNAAGGQVNLLGGENEALNGAMTVPAPAQALVNGAPDSETSSSRHMSSDSVEQLHKQFSIVGLGDDKSSVSDNVNSTVQNGVTVNCAAVNGIESSCSNLMPPEDTCYVAEKSVENGDSGSKSGTTESSVSQSEQVAKSVEELKREARQMSMTTLGPRYQPASRECSVMSSLHHFTSAELLTGNNKFGCEKCTKKKKAMKGKTEMVYTNASKHYLIFSPPAVLTLHFKRFEQIGYSSRKVNRHVDFPFTLDLSAFCSSLCQRRRRDHKRIVYSLYGVVEHSGHLSGGHYTAYVKVRPNIGLITDFLQNNLSHPREFIQHYTEMHLNGCPDAAGADVGDDEVPIPPGRWYHISDSRVSEVPETSVQTAQAYLLFYERVC